jgi:predicted nucleic acid-binding protein
LETKVKYLVDTNVWLERLLDQEKSSVVESFLEMMPTSQLFISDFALHSIGVILSRLRKPEVFEKFLSDLFLNGQIERLSLNTVDLFEVVANIARFNLDFDDSYQLTIAQKFDLVVVTFDKDFDILGINKTSPEKLNKQ